MLFAPKIFSIYILNKAGGLIYQNDLNPGLLRLTANDYLVLAGTLHGVHAIATRLHPDGVDRTPNEPSAINTAILATGKAKTPNSNRLGLQNIDTDQFSLYVFQALTGVKFIIVTSPAKTSEATLAGNAKSDAEKQLDTISEVFKQIYLFYCDYVMKNPFYSLDMPIKSALFETRIKTLGRTQ